MIHDMDHLIKYVYEEPCAAFWRNRPIYCDKQVDVLRQDMDAGQFERIWNSGRALTMEQALQFALGENAG